MQETNHRNRIARKRGGGGEFKNDMTEATEILMIK
jgi:hypothetical protein